MTKDQEQSTFDIWLLQTLTPNELLAHIVIDMFDYPDKYESFRVTNIELYDWTLSIKSIKLNAIDPPIENRERSSIFN